MKKVLIVDVDLSITDSLTPWLKWYQELTGHNIQEEMKERGENNIQEMMTEHHSPLDYWKIEDMYDNLEPFPEAVRVLTNLQNYVDIIFASASFPEHTYSKEDFCTRNFPYMKGFISTHTKGFIQGDYFVDDYTKYLDQVKERNPNCKLFMVESEINHKDTHLYKRYSWDEIEKEILKDFEC